MGFLSQIDNALFGSAPRRRRKKKGKIRQRAILVKLVGSSSRSGGGRKGRRKKYPQNYTSNYVRPIVIDPMRLKAASSAGWLGKF